MLRFVQPLGGGEWRETELLAENVCVTYTWEGWDKTLSFELPTGHPQIGDLAEKTTVIDTEDGQAYTISSINGGGKRWSYNCELDLDELCATLLTDWRNYGTFLGITVNKRNLAETLQKILGNGNASGWTVNDQSGGTSKLKFSGFYGTPLTAIRKAREIWVNYPLQFDNAQRVITICNPAAAPDRGAYLTDELNLTSPPSFKGRAARRDFYNHLTMYGDGISVTVTASNLDTSDKTVWRAEQDTSIGSKSVLRAKAQAMVDAAARPVRSYTCAAMDLAQIHPELYGSMTYQVYDWVTLLEREFGRRTTQRIAQIKRYRGHPEKDEITLATTPARITRTETSLAAKVEQEDDA